MEYRSPISAPGPSNPHQNHLLDALPSDDYEQPEQLFLQCPKAVASLR